VVTSTNYGEGVNRPQFYTFMIVLGRYLGEEGRVCLDPSRKKRTASRRSVEETSEWPTTKENPSR
jgi:hypothetical protein